MDNGIVTRSQPTTATTRAVHTMTATCRDLGWVRQCSIQWALWSIHAPLDRR